MKKLLLIAIILFSAIFANAQWQQTAAEYFVLPTMRLIGELQTMT